MPNHKKISSYFGKRSSPTAYASSFHKGIDIPAPPGTNIYAAMSGIVVLAKFNGSGGCTVTIQSGNIYTSYCHVSPNFLVSPGVYVEKGQIIAQVGPKNVYGFSDNKYKDNNDNPTNGATTGPHLHFAVREDSTYLNPLNFF
ncbi:MAG: M23 family metallopeptidase [Clostridia bacterium]|nr:M23 family metallopeptidase [Clostridia bacterium]